MEYFKAFDETPGFGTFNFITGDNGAGKTHFLTAMASNVLSQLLNGQSGYENLICLTSTVYEKFPRPLKKDSEYLSLHEKVYSYFGGRVNNNVFSDISPFRTIIKCFCRNETRGFTFTLIKDLLTDLDFKSSVVCLFRDEEGQTKNIRSFKNVKEITLDFSMPPSQISEYIRRQILSNDLFLMDIKFERVSDTHSYGVRELSSGERNFVITILSIVFTIKNRSLILFDEPENSMHPKWQEKITSVIKLIVDEMSPESTVIIATHSPLVVSSVSNESVFIMNLPGDKIWKKSFYSGNNSDSVLKNQFGLVSSRSLNFVLKFQECLKLYTQGEINSFVHAMDDFFRYEVIISTDDPLYEAFNTLQELYVELKQQ
ncbi:TPA: ATP-binding protein [Serratia fonticola]|nr:ATP-binding protein [Serratia fonticola]